MEGHPIVQQWLQRLEHTASQAQTEFPEYWSSDPSALVTTSDIHGTIELGTGFKLYADSILPVIENAETEVILVTCFWANSATLTAIGESLRKLSEKSLRRGGSRISVRLCFSSLSLFQKLFHTSSLRGQTYSPSQWTSKLGLPGPEELKGLQLDVKSIFIRPFSVLHPKFVIIDRQVVILPSCNVSWEDWFEGCILLSGDIVGQFVRFWNYTWVRNEDGGPVTRHNGPVVATEQSGYSLRSKRATTHAQLSSVFLPSPHHVNPRFSLLPWRECPPPPPTPLNAFLLTAIESAQHKIYMQTPNLTSPPVLSALLAALKRGINVEILTSERLMILEQLVTAGTTTSRCVRMLIKRHRHLLRYHRRRTSGNYASLESGPACVPGELTVSFYRPRPASRWSGSDVEPVQSHLKLTIVDEEWTVLGSGNMDRASWFTSQELGLALFSAEFASSVFSEVRKWMAERTSKVYNSSAVG